tara:strand:- start:34 stop:816 length:783 start_codon:yes stop_codon:yes gene_type:complete
MEEKQQLKANYTPLWPVPFGWSNIGEKYRELNKRLVEDIETERGLDEGKGGTFKNNDLGWQSKNTMEQKYTSFSELVPIIKSIATPIMHRSGLHESVTSNVQNLWANVILGQGGYSFPHTHGQGDTLWTGVYYPKGLQDIENLDELEVSDTFQHGTARGGGMLVVRDGNLSKGLVKATRDGASRTAYDRNFSVIPRESLLVLFPAWLEHMVTPTENDEKRYSISFGIFRKSNIVKPYVSSNDSKEDTIEYYNDEVTVEKE